MTPEPEKPDGVKEEGTEAPPQAEPQAGPDSPAPVPDRGLEPAEAAADLPSSPGPTTPSPPEAPDGAAASTPMDPWTQITRDRWFFGVLTAAFVAVLVLLAPYGFVLLFAATTAVVTWPVYEVVLRRTGNRPALAAVLTLLLLIVLVLGPLTLVVYQAASEGVFLVRQAVDWVASGEFERWAQARVNDFWESGLLENEWVQQVMPEQFELLPLILEPLRSSLLGVGAALGGALPKLVNSVVAGGIDAIIFVFALLTLYMEGPAFLRFLSRLLPMDDAYEERLFHVFQEFANNMVIGSLATGALQGLVASVGYAIAGVERVAFMGLLTGLFSFVPLVGTAVVWVPVTLYVATTQGWAWGLFLALWSLLLTGSVDNLVKPLFLRGSSDIHPLLIFLAVFGGLTWMGVPGALIGPVVVASFLALYTIYCRDYLGVEPAFEAPRPEGRIARMLRERKEKADAEDG